jgi:DNA-binding XRE family transcriptional regulator
MRKIKPKTTTLADVLEIEYKKDPSFQHEVESRVQALKTLMKLRETRIQFQMSQLELAQKSGVPQKTISEIENGKRNITLETLFKLSIALGKEVEIVFK